MVSGNFALVEFPWPPIVHLAQWRIVSLDASHECLPTLRGSRIDVELSTNER